jgi:uncharacterized membrane protein YccC
VEAFLYGHQALTHAAKTGLATLIGVLAGWLLSDHVDHPEWIVITIVVVMVMMPNVGGVLQRAIFRLIGTAVAAIIAVGVIAIAGNNNVAIILTLILGVTGFTALAQIAKYRHVAMLCAITLAILLQVDEPDERVILHRGLSIIAGVIIALVITRFVCPIRASRQLRFQMADAIDQLAVLFTMAAADEETSETIYEEHEDRIAVSIRTQRELLPLALIEHPALRRDKPSLEYMMRSQRTIMGLTRTLRRAYSHTELGIETIRSLAGLAEVRTRITDQLNLIAEGIRTGVVPPPDPELAIVQAALKVAMKQAVRALDEGTMSPQAFTFALEQVINATESIRLDAARW